jgi:ubiquinone/menaquinone biosynthesis C-methylase UbiE
MAKSDRNRTTPKTDYDWKEGGEEWSGPWGTSAAQWYGAIYSRMHGCLPADTILEIAPGFGRWTHYLKDHCQHLYIVDPTAKCIEACRQRFGDDSGLSYHINDGRSLAMIADCSIDFVFSFDSMVHVRRDILEGYLSQLTAKLKPDGLGFVHHSNLGQYAGSAVARAPKPVRKLLTKMKVLDSDKRRAPDMTAELFRSACAEHGLQCISQEVVNWRGRQLIDCFSLFTKKDSKWDGPLRFRRNPNFMQEAEMIRRWSAIYPGMTKS